MALLSDEIRKADAGGFRVKKRKTGSAGIGKSQCRHAKADVCFPGEMGIGKGGSEGIFETESDGENEREEKGGLGNRASTVCGDSQGTREQTEFVVIGVPQGHPRRMPEYHVRLHPSLTPTRYGEIGDRRI